MIEIFLLLFIIIKSSSITPNTYKTRNRKRTETEQTEPDLSHLFDVDSETLDSKRKDFIKLLDNFDELRSLLKCSNNKVGKSDLKLIIQNVVEIIKQEYQNFQVFIEKIKKPYFEIKEEYEAKGKDTAYIRCIIHEIKERINIVYNVLSSRIHLASEKLFEALLQSIRNNREILVWFESEYFYKRRRYYKFD